MNRPLSQPTPPVSQLHAAARAAAMRGKPVFPLAPNSKVPLISKAEGGNGVHDATTDLTQIDEWWTTCPDANIGWCPEGAGMCLADLDTKKADGVGTWNRLCAEHGMAPATDLVIATPSGGRHICYQGSLPPTQRKIGEGIDTRGRYSYGLLPPSVIDGVAYHYLAGDETIQDFALDPVPDWIVERCAPAVEEHRTAGPYAEDTQANIDHASAYLARCVTMNPDDPSQNDYAVACRVLDFGVSKERGIELAVARGADPEWARLKFENASTYKQNEDGCDTSASAFKRFVDGLQPAQPEPARPGNDNTALNNGVGAPRRRFAVKSPTEWWDRPAPDFYDADHMLLRIPGGAVGVVYGESGHHKTNVLLTKLYEAAEQHGIKILYVAGEGVYGFCRDRTQAHAKLRNLTREWVAEHIGVVESVPILTSENEVDEFIRDVEASRPRWKPDIVVIDTLATGTPGTDENAKAMSDILSDNGAAGAIKHRWRSLVLCVSHEGKDRSKGIRGHSGQYGNVDIVLNVAKHEHNECAIKIECKKMRDGEREGGKAFYKVEPSGVPVPVRITEGEYREMTRDADGRHHVHADQDEIIVRRLLRHHGYDSDWAHGCDDATLARLWTENDRGERPGELGDDGVAEWDDEYDDHLKCLQNAANQNKVWARGMWDKHRTRGGTVKVRHWFNPPDEPVIGEF